MIIYNDKTKRFAGEKAIPNDREGRLLYQPLSFDWVEMAQFTATGATSGLITFSDTTLVASEFFQIGDRIRFKQGGSYKYFVVISISSNTITVFGGSDYAVTAASVTNLAMSRIPNPSGAPTMFNFDGDVTALVGGATYTAGDETFLFKLDGNICIIDAYVTGSDLAGFASQISMALPIEADVSTVPQFIINITDDFAQRVGQAKINSTFVEITRHPSATFAITTNGLGFDLHIRYKIVD